MPTRRDREKLDGSKIMTREEFMEKIRVERHHGFRLPEEAVAAAPIACRWCGRIEWTIYGLCERCSLAACVGTALAEKKWES